MRPLFFDFEGDPKAAAVEDEFLFGPDVLVAPITKFEMRSREVYLPAGTEWTDARTGNVFQGGQVVVADAPIEHIPVYLRGNKPDLMKHFTGLYDLGFLEAEDLHVVSKSQGRVEPQAMAKLGSLWGNNSQMVWRGGLNKGDSLVLEVPIERTAEYKLQLHLSKAHDYGVFRFQLDNGPVSDAVDLYSPKLQGPFAFTLKPMKLSKGKHQLNIVCQGKNPESTNTVIGLDYVVLKTPGK
jgi:hypothetical protein